MIESAKLTIEKKGTVLTAYSKRRKATCMFYEVEDGSTL